MLLWLRFPSTRRNEMQSAYKEPTLIFGYKKLIFIIRFQGAHCHGPEAFVISGFYCNTRGIIKVLISVAL